MWYAFAAVQQQRDVSWGGLLLIPKERYTCVAITCTELNLKSNVTKVLTQKYVFAFTSAQGQLWNSSIHYWLAPEVL